jgi:sulfatase modifying factor 1
MKRLFFAVVRPFFLTFLFGLLATAEACFVDSACFSDADCPDKSWCDIPHGSTSGKCKPMCFKNADCPEGFYCELTLNRCQKAECRTSEECPEGFMCRNGWCTAESPLKCPDGMVPVERQFCVDIYEASRPDADAELPGVDGSMAVSRVGVIPWRVKDNAEADAACAAAGKRLCTEDEWYQACIGPNGTVYGYGDTYDPLICNGIDTFCYCDKESCQNRDPCPFPHCYQVCGAALELLPTGAFPDCRNGYGIFDINGNVWEHVMGGDETRIRGGAFNCLDSVEYHRCDYIPGTWTPAARGFRCCADGWIDADGGAESEGGD